ncbi:MAG TPA: hypothetical protein VGD08_18075 [Stellaceae bacterium]
MRKLFGTVSLCSLTAALLFCGPALADKAPQEQQDAITHFLKGKLPTDWSVVHIVKDENLLITYLTMPVQKAFELAYQPEDTRDMLQKLCPPSDQPLWSVLGPSDMALEPVANGKGFFRVRCKSPNKTSSVAAPAAPGG